MLWCTGQLDVGCLCETAADTRCGVLDRKKYTIRYILSLLYSLDDILMDLVALCNWNTLHTNLLHTMCSVHICPDIKTIRPAIYFVDVCLSKQSFDQCYWQCMADCDSM